MQDCGTSMTTADSSRADLAVAAMLFVIGVVVGSLATMALTSYHGGPALLRVSGAYRLQYDTAWILLLCGMSLVTYAVSFRGIARILAGGAALIGALRIAVYLVPQALSTHPILSNPWLPHAAREYDAMGILTALVAVILGASLAFLLPGSRRTPWRSVALAIVA